MSIIIGGGIIIFLCLLMIVLLIKFGYEKLTDFVILFFYVVIDIIPHLYNKFKIKIEPEYKNKNNNIELTISNKLDKLNIKDVESVLKYYKLDDKVKGVTFDMNPKDIETYLRKKKIKKLK